MNNHFRSKLIGRTGLMVLIVVILGLVLVLQYAPPAQGEDVIAAPALTTPVVDLPTLAIPTLNLPQITLPPFTFPTGVLPTLVLPPVGLPLLVPSFNRAYTWLGISCCCAGVLVLGVVVGVVIWLRRRARRETPPQP